MIFDFRFSILGLRGRIRTLVVAAASMALLGPAGADRKPKQPDWSKGALYGQVVDATTGKPVAGATVALTDPKGKVLAWTRTNEKGEYAIAADPLTALQLRPSHRRGLLEEVYRSVGDVVAAPVKMAAEVVKEPGKVLKATALGVATGNPLPAAAAAAAPVVGVAQDPKAAAQQTEEQARTRAAQAALADKPRQKDDPSGKGEALILVSAPNYKECKSKDGAFWLEPPDTPSKGAKPVGLKAWLETVELAPASSNKNSDVKQEAITIADPHVDPVLVTAGDTVQISCKVNGPVSAQRPLRVFARENRRHTVVELMPGQNGVYSGAMQLDPKEPAGETAISIAALRADPVEVKLDKKKADPLPEFVRRLDDLDADKPYAYDPRIMASENRVDVKLTVLDSKQATPAQQAAPPAPGGNAAPTQPSPAPPQNPPAPAKPGDQPKKG